MWRVRACAFLFFLVVCSGSLMSQANENDLKKAAGKAFEEEEWGQGFKLYSTLVSNYPKDPEYNYRLGVCALFSEEDKKKCLTYLEFASKREKEVEKEVFFYLGKAYHLNYRFDDAMKFYTAYKQNASSSMQKKLQVDREIQCCKNAKRLLSNVRELVILDKKRLNQADYFRSYDLRDIRGKLLVKPSDFASPNDKKKKERSVIYLPPSKDQLYYSSYGTGENKDIYIVNRLPSGEWGKPELLPGAVNTEYDEDYPFLHPNGMVLYFASKGHNSMGGYDVFKSEYDEGTKKWKEPVNLDFPINSPSDDYLFVTDSLEKIAFLASTRQTPWGKTDVFKILTERRAAEFAFISGTVIKKTPSKIIVKNTETGEDEGTFTADANGEYNIKLSNGGKFIFTVETPGIATQSAGVNVPTSYSYKPYRQTIDYENQKLVITNFFEANDQDDNNYSNYLALIEEKSKMNVNASDFDVNPDNPYDTKNNPPANTNTTVATNTSVATNTTNTTVTTNTTATTNSTTTNVSNKQLIDIAYTDAKEAQEEANNLKNDATTAFKAANSKQDQLNETKQDLQEVQNKINTETDPAKKQELINQEDKLKQDVALYDKQAKTANNIAQQLQVDADNKQKEANLNQEYAKALEEADKTKNNKQAIAKLESLQKQLEDLSKQKSGSDALVESMKADAKNKEQELNSAEKKQDKLDKEEADIKTQIADIDQQIEKTKDKGLLDNLNAQKDELKTDLADKQKESQANKNKINTLKDESDALNSQVEYATNIAAGKTPVETTPTYTVASTNTTVATNSVTSANTSTVNATNTNSVTPTNSVVTTNTVSTNPVETNTTSAVETHTTTVASNTTTAVETNTVSAYTEKTKQLDESLASLSNTSTNSLDDNKKKSDLLTQYVQATDAEIKEKKQELAKTKDADQKKNLNNEIKQLTEKKAELQKEEKLVNNQVKEQEKQAAIASKNNKVDSTNKTNTTAVITPVSDTSQAKIVSDNDDSRIQNINTLITQSQTGLSDEKKVFDKGEYTDPKAVQLKAQADAKLNELTKTNADLELQLEELKMEVAKENAGNNDKKIQQLSKQANDLSAQSLQLRKDAKNLSGAEKQNALSKILSLEKDAIGFRYQAARLQYLSDDDNFQVNKQAITRMTSGEYQGTQVQQAIQLSREADKSKQDAARLREEAEAQHEVEAKIGALSNADEKEKEALKKQEDALALLKQINPQNNANLSSEKKAEDLRVKIDKEAQASVAALKLLADANKAEYNALLTDVNKTEKSSGTKPGVAELKTEAQNTYKTANDEYTKLGSLKEDKQKRESLLDINNKLGDAVLQLRNAKRLLNGEEIFAANTNTVTATTNSVTANTNSVTVNTNTATVNSNTVAVNNNPENSNTVNTNTTSVTTSTTTETNTVSVAATNTVEANNNTTINTNTVAITNTNTTTANNNTSATLTDAQKEEIKATPEYKQYATLQNEVVKYNNQVIKDESASKEYRNKYEALQSEIAGMPEGEQKTAKQKEAEQVKVMADSLQEIANNTRQLAESKKQEADTYGQNLDKKTYDNIVAVAATDNTTNTNPAIQKYANYSEPFRNSANQKDEKLAELRTGTSTPEKLKEQNQVIDAYVKDIDREIADKRQIQLATTDSDEKKKLAQQVKNLQTRKNELLTEKKTNENIIRFAGGNNASTAGTNTVAANNNANTTNTNTTTATSNSNAVPIKGNGFEVKTGNAYSNANPIPVNEKLPEGLVFRVQIGAFKTAIDPARFAGLSPVGAETTNFGFIRYQVGMFNDYQQANAVKNDLRKLKYTDAFVVPYLNGKRIPLAEALDMMAKQGTDITTSANTTAGITANSNIPVNPEPNNNTVAPVASQGNLDSFNGVFYTVQVGVFGNNVSAAGLRNLHPIFKEALPTGYYRYTAGIYNNYEKALTDRKRVVDLGIKDAFVSGYMNGKRQSVNEPLPPNLEAQFLPEKPIVFPGAGANTTKAAVNNNTTLNNVQPVSNGVKEGPAPTPENGVKTTEEGITYKVQIGAYSKQVPVQVVNNWLKIKTWPIRNTVINNLYVYTVGSFTEARFAKSLRDEVITLGLADAYVVVYKDGKKLYGAEAAQYLNR